MEETIFKNLRYIYILLNGLIKTKPDGNFNFPLNKERIVKYHNYYLLNEVREIEWKKCFNNKRNK